MVNEVIKAITKHLGDLVPAAQDHIYIEDTDQNLKEPCFIVKVISSMVKDLLPPYQRIYLTFSVTFVCSNDIWSLRAVAESLSYHFRFLELQDGSIIEPTDRQIQFMTDDYVVMTFNVGWTATVETEEKQKMEILQLNVEVKDD